MIPPRPRHVQGRGGPAGVPGRQAALPPSVAVPVRQGQRHGRFVEGGRQVRRRTAARPERPRLVHPRRSQPGDQQVRQEQEAARSSSSSSSPAEEQQRPTCRRPREAPTWASLYDDPEPDQAVPVPAELKASIEKAQDAPAAGGQVPGGVDRHPERGLQRHDREEDFRQA